MDPTNTFHFQNDELLAETVKLTEIAEQVGTPCYVYSKKALETNWLAFKNALIHRKHQIHYAVKANSNLAVLNILAKLGSGFDIVSGGELERVLAAKGHPNNIVFSGVGKTTLELQRALEVGVGCINIESEDEVNRLNRIANQMNTIVPIAIRVNPNIDAESHPYISTGLKENKFGIDISDIKNVYRYTSQLSNLKIEGIACHIGSQLTSLTPFMKALDQILLLVDDLIKEGYTIKHLNFGGGLGIRYRDENPPTPENYIKAIDERLGNRELALHLEPGRAIVANAGILLTRVEYIKKQFAIVDAGMNDFLRPALYNAWQEIVPIVSKSNVPPREYDIVGPVCETSDFLGKKRSLSIQTGDLLAILSAGAYGFSMSSHYNSRPKPAEVIVDKNQFHIVRSRENYEDLFFKENLIP